MSQTKSKASEAGEALFKTHEQILATAREAIRTRSYTSPFPEIPSGKIYGETAAADGQAAFEARLNKPFEIDQPASGRRVGSEISPYGIKLGVSYPEPALDALLAAAEAAMESWRTATPEARAGVCLEILTRLNKRSFELAHAVMHTTGQSFIMAFQAGGPHAQDRGLEALAFAYDEMRRYPGTVKWEKRVGKTETEDFIKSQRIVPRGVAALIACSTFPTWNGYPGLIASLATGNAVIVKPHPGAILPLAITVEFARGVLAECGFDPNVVTLAADDAEAPIAKDLINRPEIKIVDYTGSTSFGEWIESNARGKAVFTEKAGVNCAVIDSVDDVTAMARNLAFSMSLYAGQMCTSPQNIFVPAGGIPAGGSKISFDEVANAIVGAVDGLLGEEKRAVDILGAIQNNRTIERIEKAAGLGATVLRASGEHVHPQFENARIRSPLVLSLKSSDEDKFTKEWFGPIVCIIATKNTDESLALAEKCARETGSITCAVYSTKPDVQATAEDVMTRAGAPVCFNLTGQKLINHAAAFSDFHVSGLNPSGNATFCDAAFVTPRFRFVQTCRPA